MVARDPDLPVHLFPLADFVAMTVSLQRTPPRGLFVPHRSSHAWWIDGAVYASAGVFFISVKVQSTNRATGSCYTDHRRREAAGKPD